MLFRDMRCFSCGNPPEKETLPQGEKLGMTSFSAVKGEMLEVKPCEHYSIRICDSCLTEGGRQGRVTRTVAENRPSNIYEFTWNPDGSDSPYLRPLPKPAITRPKEES